MITSSRYARAATAALAAVAFLTAGPWPAASANHSSAVDAISLAPSAASEAVGGCQTYVVGLTANGRTAEGELVDVVTSESPARSGTDVDFCVDGAAAPVRQTDSGPGGTTDRAEYRTLADGTVTLGITASATGTVDIQVFADRNGDDTRQGDEPQRLAVLYATTRDVSCVDARPESATVLAGQEASTLVTLTNNVATNLSNGTTTGGGNVSDSGTGACGGDTVPGVVPRVVLSGANAGAPVSCAASDTAGVARCAYIASSTGTDTLLVFVDEGGTAGKDPGEAGDTVTRTVGPAPTGLQVDLVCASTDRSGPEDCLEALPLSGGADSSQLVAVVTGPDGGDSGSERDPASGISVVFTENGADATVSSDCTTDGNGRCTVTLTEATPVSGEVVSVTATIRGQNPAGDLAEDATSATGERTSDTARVTWRGAAASARYVDLTPEGPFTTTAGTTREVTARVTDVDGATVQGVQVTFTESGPGTFTAGGTVVVSTDAAGTARAVLTSASTDRGSQQVTATISTTGTRCSAAAGSGGTSATPNPPAGSCSDTEENRLVAAPAPSPSPSRSPSPSPSPSPTGPAACSTAATVFAPVEITYGSFGNVTVRATAGKTVTLFAYTRPSTTYRAVRTGAAGVDGLISWSILPPGNTRLYAQESGCAAGPSVVTAVRSVASINAFRLGSRLYTFSGSVQPRRPGQLVSLYRRTATGDVLTSQVRTDVNGVWAVTRRFSGSGSFGFLARSGNDLVNLGATSRVRPTVVF